MASSASTFISVNAESGEILAVRSFDYEQTKEFNIRVKAQDGGNPPLSSNVSVKIKIQDQNDNAPQVLYPVQSGASVVAEIVPRSADVGYLVTKVVLLMWTLDRMPGSHINCRKPQTGRCLKWAYRMEK